MRKNLRDFEGTSAVFIDATVFLHHAFDANPVSVEFLSRIELSNIKAYTSALVLEEVSYKIMMQSASNFLEKVSVQHVKKLLENQKNRGKVFTPLIEYMESACFLQDCIHFVMSSKSIVLISLRSLSKTQ